jgi:20S proteasome subunit beta 6
LLVAQGELTLPEVEDLVKDAFNSAGERDIYTGDFVDTFVITKDGAQMKKFDLKLD